MWTVIVFEPIDYANRAHCELIARWENDPTIRPLVIPQKADGTTRPPADWKTIQERGLNSERAANRVDLFIVDSETAEMVGLCDVMIDPPHRMTFEGKVGWLGILIGNPAYRGRGVGPIAIAELERRARELGCDRLEAGAFEYNEPSRRMFAKLGYEPIGQNRDAFFYDGRFWADLRFGKRL